MEALIIAGMAACVAAMVGLRFAAHPERKRARRRIAAAAPLVATSREGAQVRATGIVRAMAEGAAAEGATDVAPLTGLRCVAYRVHVRARRGRYAYASVHEESHVRAFVLERAGEPPVVVEGTAVVLDLPPARLAVGREGGERRVELLRALGLRDANASQSHFEEVVVEVGATVTVAGRLARGVSGEAPVGERLYREGAGEVLRVVGDAAHPIAIG